MKELIEKIGKGTRKKTVKVLAGIVAFATAYSLILPAITIDEETAQEEPGMVLNENENTEEVLAEYEAPEEVAEAPEEEPVIEEAPAEEVKEETPAEEVKVETPAEEPAAEEPKEEAPAEEAKPAEETKPAETVKQEEKPAEETVVKLPAVAGKLEYEAKDDYKITAEYTEAAGLTEKAKLEVKETLKEDEYTNLLVNAQKEFEDDIAQARFFEVKFLDNNNAKKAEGKVTVTYIPYKAFELDDTQELTIVTLDSENKFHEIDEKKIEFKVTDKKTEEIKFETEEFDDFAVIVTENIPEGYPAKEFAGKAGDVTVKVSAPEGAFPEGTTMTVTAVAEDKVIDQVTDAVEYRVGKVRAVDITFKDKDGKEIEPMKQIKVSMTSDLIKAADTAEIVHIDDEGKGSVVEQSSDKSAADEVIFESKDFSIYVIAETIEGEFTLTTPDGNDVTYVASVTYGSEANIPKDASLRITEFAEDSAEYIEAKDAVVEAKKAENENFNEKSIGIVAMDISIVDAEGNVIEPADNAEVKVSFRMKKLPEDVSEKAFAQTVEIGHLNEATGEKVLETVAISEEVVVDNGTATAEFTVNGFSTFTLSWANGSSIVHFGTMENDTFVEFGEESQIILDDSNGVGTINLNIFVEGHSYYFSYYVEGGEEPVTYMLNGSVLTQDSNGWKTNVIINDPDDPSSSTIAERRIADGSDIYVVFTEKQEHESSAGHTDVKGPTTIKNVIDNEDNDTSKTIRLDVSAPVITEEDKVGANVLIILDTTESMLERMNNQTTMQRWTAAQTAIDTLVNTLTTGENAGNDIEFALLDFHAYGRYSGPPTYWNPNNSYSNRSNQDTHHRWNATTGAHTTSSNGVDWTKNSTAFNNHIQGMSPTTYGYLQYSFTNWENPLTEAASFLDTRDGDPTYIIFITDGEPNTYGTGTPTITYPNPAPECRTRPVAPARALVQAPNTTLYGVFCGTDEGGETLGNLISAVGGKKTIQGTDENTLRSEFEGIAWDIIQSLGSSGVSVDDGITELSSISAQLPEGETGGYEYYRSYKLTVNGNTGTYKIGDTTYTVQMSDENVWSREETSGTTTTTVYYYETVWNGAPAAAFSDDNGVTWDISEVGTLQPDVIYTVKFDVWPSQAAFDLIANLNNGTQNWNSLSADVQNQIDRIPNGASYIYRLKTNTHLFTTYTFNGNTYTDPFDKKEGELKLESTQMNVRKAFAHDINKQDPYTRIIFYLLVDGKYYQTDGTTSATLDETKVYQLPVDATNNWTNHVYIAPGVIKEGRLLETGHSYSLDEKIVAGNEFEYEFTPQTVRPMEIDGELTYLVMVDKYNPVPSESSVYYINDSTKKCSTSEIEGATQYYMVPVEEGSNGELVGTNRKTAELDITKVIKDLTGNFTEEQLDNETFTYRVTFTVPSDADLSGFTAHEYVPRYDDPLEPGRRYLIFGYQDTETPATVRGFDDDVERFSGKVHGDYTVTTSTTSRYMTDMFVLDEGGQTKTATIDITLKRNEIIRFTNIPEYTEYTIVEMYNNYRQADPSRDVDAGGSTMPSNIADMGYVTTIATKSRNPVTNTPRTGAVEGTTVTGTIDYLDVRYYNQFTNTLRNVIDIEITGTKHLDNYEWSGERYYFNLAAQDEEAPLPIVGAYGRLRFYLTEASGSADKSYSFGSIRFTEPGTYTYTVTEDNAGTIQDVNGTLVKYGGPETITIVIGEDNTGKLYIDSVTGSDNVTWNAEDKVVNAKITNEAASVDVKLKKVDEEDNELSGASFDLTTFTSSWEIVSTDIKPGDADTETTNPVDLGNLKVGRYRLEEKSGPKGYIILKKFIYFEVYRNEGDETDPISLSVRLTDEDGDPIESMEGITLSSEGSDDYVFYLITVKNIPGEELPHTGGSGTLPYTLGGLILIILSASMYGFMMRRRERRFDN